MSYYLSNAKQAKKQTSSDLIRRLLLCFMEDLKQLYTPHRTNKQHKGRYQEQVLAIEELLSRAGEPKDTQDITFLLDNFSWPKTEEEPNE